MNFPPAEFARTLDDIAEARIDARPVLTGVVSPAGVARALADLADPERRAKIVVRFDGAA